LPSLSKSKRTDHDLAVKRQGLITFDQTHSLQVAADITIRPTITEAVDESFLARLEAWGGSSSNKDNDEPEEPASDGVAESDALPGTSR
jgi:hypothetical protein